MHDVMPRRFIRLIAARSALAFCSTVGSGMMSPTSPTAASWSSPVGSPSSSWTMCPSGGSGVTAVIPASSSAREFDQGGVSVQRMHDDRARGVQDVQVVLLGDGARGLDRLVVPVADDQPAVGLLVMGLLQAARDDVAHLVQGQLRVVQAARAEPPARRQGMHVCVVDARHDRPSGQVDDLGGGADQIGDPVVRTDVHDDVVADGHAGGRLRQVVEREHGAAPEHDARLRRPGQCPLDGSGTHQPDRGQGAALGQERSSCAGAHGIPLGLTSGGR